MDELAPLFDDLVEIGDGASSVVYQGREKSTGDPVVIKFFLHDRTWRREVAVLTYVRDHTAYPIGRVELLHLEAGQVALVFDWAGDDWVSLDRLGGRLTGEEAATLTAELFSAIALLHSADVFHRDIKPENILFNREIGKARLIDFGLACRARDGLVGCAADKAQGTHHFLPRRLLRPEFQHDAVSAREQDTWGVSATVYGVVAGDSPYGQIGIESRRDILATPTRVVLDRALADPAGVNFRESHPGPAGAVERVLWSEAE